MANREELERLFKKHELQDFKWINPGEIIVAQWVRMKCIFGCGDYGKCASCPPNTPSIPECKSFFKEYNEGAIFHFAKNLQKPEDRHPWCKETQAKLLEVEREVFLSGYHKAFLLLMDNCSVCKECQEDRLQCINPKKSRPSVEAMGVDVYGTVRQYGFPINVLADYSATMNRYAFLMVE